MQSYFPNRALAALCFLLLALNLCGLTMAQDATRHGQPLGALSSFRTIAADTLAIVNAGNLARAKARIKDLETTWDRAETRLRPRDSQRWLVIDKAIDAALVQLRADRPQAQAAKDALQNQLASLDRSNQSATATVREAAAATSPTDSGTRHTVTCRRICGECNPHCAR